MDPLSITTGIVTLIAATSSTIKFLERVKSRKHGAVEIASTRNSLTDLVCILNSIVNNVETLRSSTPGVYTALADAINQLAGTVGDLEAFLLNDLLDDSGKVSLRRWSGENRSRLQSLKSAIDIGRQNLHMLISSAPLSFLPMVLGAIREIGIVGESRESRMEARIEEFFARLAIEDENINANSSQAAETSNSRPGAVNTASHSINSSLFYIKTTSRHERCGPLCQCQCHSRTSGRTPQWLSVVFGTLFFTYSAKPRLNQRKCSTPSCRQLLTSGSSYYTYYFPTWMVRGVLSISTFKDIHGRNASWTISMPRVVPNESPVWYIIDRGDVDGLSSAADFIFKSKLQYGQDDEDILCLHNFVQGYEDDMELHLSPLHKIITGLSSLPLGEYLLTGEANIDAQDWLGMTPLMWASRLGNYEYVKNLLRETQCLDIRSNEGSTSLHYAVFSGDLSVFQALLEAGADPHIRDVSGDSPVMCAIRSNRDSNSAVEILQLLQDAGSSFENRNLNDECAIDYCARYNKAKMLEFLISTGLDLNVLNSDGLWPPIALAILNDSYEALSILCAHKARPQWRRPLKNVEEQAKLAGLDELDDILKTAASYGLVTSMDILADSELDMVRYDPCIIWEFFYEERRRYFLQDPSLEEEIAFLRLLERKGIPVKPEYPSSPNILDHLQEKFRKDSEDGDSEYDEGDSEDGSGFEDEESSSEDEESGSEDGGDDGEVEEEIFMDAVEMLQ